MATVARRVLCQTRSVATAVARTATDPAPTSPLNVRVGVARRNRFLGVPLQTFRAARDDYQQLRGARDCTVTDVILTALTGALRTWLQSRGEPVHGTARAVSYTHLDVYKRQVLVLARELADLVVVDCGFCLENDEELSYDTAAPRRNAATLTTLAVADHLVVVGAGEPLGLHRLVRGLQELGTVRAPADRTVVINRLRASAVGELSLIHI